VQKYEVDDCNSCDYEGEEEVEGEESGEGWVVY